FQQAAVEHICGRLRDRSGSRRFLLADEVGLGKTIVAREVIQRLSARRQRQGRPFVVVYLCSNAEIAEQNRKKLDGNAGRPLRRVTELAVRGVQADSGEVRLYSFTPGTSLDRGTGMAWERQLLLYLLHRVCRLPVKGFAWRDFFRCGVEKEAWRQQTRLRKLRQELKRKVSPRIAARLREVWSQPMALDEDTPSFVPLRDLEGEVLAYDEERQDNRRRRNRIVAALRHGMQQAAIDHLRPQLVILDEVQRFRDVLDKEHDETSIASRLFSRGTPVLILSATPYKMLTLPQEERKKDGEGEHYKNFLQTVAFLLRRRDGQAPPELEKDLYEFGERLREGHFLSGPDARLRALKLEIERRLKPIMCRTERNRYIEDLGKGIQEVRAEGDDRVPGPEELAEFLRLRRFLFDKVQTGYHITEFWKSCPSPLTFLDSDYAAMKAVRERSATSVEPGLVTPEARLPKLLGRNHRFRTMRRRFFGDEGAPWKFLWTRPAYTYYRDGFFGEQPPRKMLVFSSWRFVPKAVSLLISHEAERGWKLPELESAPLRFSQRSGSHIFSVCFPSVGLASVVDPAALASEELTSTRLVRRAERALRKRLAALNVTVGASSRHPWLRVMARLDSGCEHAGEILDAISGWEPQGEDEAPLGFKRERDRYLEWFEDRETPLVISEKRFARLARIAAFSPAVSILRALWSVYAESRGQLPRGALDLCMGELRHYLNRRQVQAIIQAHPSGRRHYFQRVLSYCADAHFQAVMDEYAFLLSTVLQRENAVEAVKQLRRVFGMGVGTPNINQTKPRPNADGTERLTERPHPSRSHLALAYGEELSSERGSPIEESKEGRQTSVREAFNSPFWPFVLTTTSKGQEGLDFHLYCRDIVHWNLPANPVDLEQREGRINRRDGLVIRRNIARDWPLARLGTARGGAHNPWHRVFEALKDAGDLQRYKHGLFPHWIYECERHPETERLQRHLVFSSHSTDAHHYERLKERLALYRLVFGQPRQQDLLEQIERQIDQLDPGQRIDYRKSLPAYTIDLSPIDRHQVLREARAEATKLAGRVPEVEQLLQAVQRMVADRSRELDPVRREVEELSAFVRNPGDGREAPELEKMREALAALLYLRTPYDAQFDHHPESGLDDDIEVIRAAHTRVFRQA
ncbi:MAG TPA: hypothetical protein VK447_13110, partial [Myxococcaceae bacterium]|nr:hypothetical protein [Myxococcaceae bacterium]